MTVRSGHIYDLEMSELAFTSYKDRSTALQNNRKERKTQIYCETKKAMERETSTTSLRSWVVPFRRSTEYRQTFTCKL